jgi:hypothetical protein
MTYRPHLSTARASAAVNAPEIIEAVVRADYGRSAAERIECLREALDRARDLITDLEAALAVEQLQLRPSLPPLEPITEQVRMPNPALWADPANNP